MDNPDAVGACVIDVPCIPSLKTDTFACLASGRIILKCPSTAASAIRADVKSKPKRHLDSYHQESAIL